VAEAMARLDEFDRADQAAQRQGECQARDDLTTADARRKELADDVAALERLRKS
jgi:hypothetical protein